MTKLERQIFDRLAEIAIAEESTPEDVSNATHLMAEMIQEMN